MDYNSFLDIDHPLSKGGGLHSFDDPIASHFTKHTPFGAHPSSLSDGSSDLWPSETGYRLPESWSQTMDSLLSQDISHSSPDTNDTGSAESAILFASDSSTTSSFRDTSSASQSEQLWRGSPRSISPSELFSLLSSDSNTEVVVPPTKLTQRHRPSNSGPPSFGEAPSTVAVSKPTAFPDGAPSAQPVAAFRAIRSVERPPTLRQLLIANPGPPASRGTTAQQQYVTPADLVAFLRPQPSVLGAPVVKSTPVRSAAGEAASSVPDLQSEPSAPSTQVSSRGLSGWEPEIDDPNQYMNIFKNDNPLMPPSVRDLKPPCPQPSAIRLPLDTVAVAKPQPRKTRKSTSATRSSSPFDMVCSDDGGDEDDDSDVYQPSSSPTHSANNSRETSPYTLQYPSEGPTPAERQSRRGKGKAKGSAALALAVVTQMSKLREHMDHEPLQAFLDKDDDDMDFEDRLLHSVCHGRKRKNSSIPLPVPVPHLIKKSRGRKVPYVPVEASEGSVNSSSSSEPSSTVGTESQSSTSTAGPVRTRGTRGRKSTTPYSVLEGGKRAYMCEVQGCGKCFVRGEHLKRHVRSIHTYDKPHSCPYSGCDKTFSRRDNLGQHVRIHLQP